MQGEIAQAAEACTWGLADFNNDHNKRTPSRRSIIAIQSAIHFIKLILNKI